MTTYEQNKEHIKNYREKLKKRKYFRDYMRKKREIDWGKMVLKRRLQDVTFNKYFTSFEQFFKTNYFIPSITDLQQILGIKDKEWINAFLQMWAMYWYFKKHKQKYVPSEKLMNLYFKTIIWK